MLLVIMNNHLYNETRARNMNGGGRFFEEGRDYNGYLGDPNVDFAKIGEAYGLRGEKVRTAGELVPALQRAIRSMRDGKAVLMDIEVEEDGPSLSQPRGTSGTRSPRSSARRGLCTPNVNRELVMNAHRGVLRLTPVCLGVWMVAVWVAPGVEGTSGAPRVPFPYRRRLQLTSRRARPR